MIRPLLSILIPTHNRAKYAFYAIRSILKIESNLFELVVTDTSADDHLQKMLEQHALLLDGRLKYIRPEEKLDMTGNHNRVVSHSSGEYVCLIGDDDTITEELIDAARWALEQDIEVIAPNVVSNYAWPDFKSIHFGFKHASRLYIPRKVDGVKYHDSANAFKNALGNAAQGTDNLPKIYHGLVKRSVMEKIKHISGNYFWGSSPDVSGAIGLALCTSKFVTVDYPLTIPGASGGSNTGRSALNQHKGKLTSEEQTKTFVEKGWSLGVPKFFSVETVWSHAAIETIQRLKPESVSQFNYAKLLAVCRIRHGEYSDEIKQAEREIINTYQLAPSSLQSAIRNEIYSYQIKRFFYVFRRVLTPTASGGRLFIGHLKTIEEAHEALKNHLTHKGWSWAKLSKA